MSNNDVMSSLDYIYIDVGVYVYIYLRLQCITSEGIKAALGSKDVHL